jgi:Kinesin motor domain
MQRLSIASHPYRIQCGAPLLQLSYICVERTGTQSDDCMAVHAAAGKAVVNSCFAGYNACVFAYGQTGSGKTFTMLGDILAAHAAVSSGSGLIPRIFDHLLSEMQRREDHPPEGCTDLRYECHIGMLEIYNESITDLLNPEATNLHVREDVQHGIRVESLSHMQVHSGARHFILKQSSCAVGGAAESRTLMCFLNHLK